MTVATLNVMCPETCSDPSLTVIPSSGAHAAAITSILYEVTKSLLISLGEHMQNPSNTDAWHISSVIRLYHQGSTYNHPG